MYQVHNLLAIQRCFPTEVACRNYLLRQRWPKGFRCPRCGFSRAGRHQPRGLYQCKKCRAQVSLTAGTLFHKTHIPLKTWFWLILLMSRNKHGVSMSEAQKLLGIGSYKTVWLMSHKIRSAMAHREGRYKLAGLVEMDDSFFGKKKEGYPKRGSQRTVRIMVSTSDSGKPGFARMEVVDYAGVLHAQQMATEHLEPGQLIRTDGGRSFPGLKEIGFKHERHVGMTPKEMDRYLPGVQMIISNAKRFLLGTHHRKAPKHLQRFLDEFTYRFNRRWVSGQLFDRLLTACVTARSVTSAELKV